MLGYRPNFNTIAAGETAIALPRWRFRLPSATELGLPGPFALSLGLHAALIFLTTAGALWNTSQQPLGILVERYGVPGAGTPATTEVDISYDLPSDVALPQKKKAKKKVTEATPSTTTSDSQEGGGRLGNAKTGAASGAMGDPNGIVVSARTRYLYELKLFFDQRKRYPAQARELGHTGEVLVGFEVLADGKIQNVAIATASRHERLNQAALALVTTAGNFKPLPPELGASPWKLTVPIRYELN